MLGKNNVDSRVKSEKKNSTNNQHRIKFAFPFQGYDYCGVHK